MKNKIIKKADDTKSAFSMPSFAIEKNLIEQKYSFVAGVDEAGRGCLAGPLCVALVIYPPEIIFNPPEILLLNINDSKKMSHIRRVEALQYIKEYSLYWDYVMVSHQTIDKLNVNGATYAALRTLLQRATGQDKPGLNAVIMDGNFSFTVEVPFFAIKKGDSRSLSIASASIVAKVSRDEVIDKLDVVYPGYGFVCNKGYGTRKHLEALQSKGFCPIHRKSYEPIKSMINENEEEKLF